MKKKLILFLILLLLTGCNNELEEEKNDYLTYKNELNKVETWNKLEELPCDITISIDKTGDEEISYRAIIDNPKVDMYNIKALLIHENFTEDVFPSIGIFDETMDLIIDSDTLRGIELVGYIETTKEIEELDLEIRIYLEYETLEGTIKQIYYKSTN